VAITLYLWRLIRKICYNPVTKQLLIFFTTLKWVLETKNKTVDVGIPNGSFFSSYQILQFIASPPIPTPEQLHRWPRSGCNRPTTNKAESQQTFPPRCATAQYHVRSKISRTRTIPNLISYTPCNASLVVRPHGCAIAYALKRTFAQREIFLSRDTADVSQRTARTKSDLNKPGYFMPSSGRVTNSTNMAVWCHLAVALPGRATPLHSVGRQKVGWLDDEDDMSDRSHCKTEMTFEWVRSVFFAVMDRNVMERTETD